jgi:NTP pyrophosphatase (non-canonical NTP hydrolase)
MNTPTFASANPAVEREYINYKVYEKFVASRFKKMFLQKEDIVHAAMGISTEAGEILDVAKKLWAYEQELGALNKEGKTHYRNLEEELGDVMFYVVAMVITVGLDFPTILQKNIDKLSKRYPTGYSNAAATERADKFQGESFE